MRFFLLICLLTLTAFSLSAQADVTYRLRVPDAESLLSTFSEAIENYFMYTSNKRNFAEAVETEFLDRFGQHADFDLLMMAYDHLKVNIICYNGAYCIPPISLNDWNTRLVQQWFDENQEVIDLDTRDTLSFADYQIEIEPHDFSGDGNHEWLLRVQKGVDEIEYSNYLVADEREGQYIILTVPLPWYADSHASNFASIHATTGELRFTDITGDGAVEWVFETHSGSHGPGYLYSYRNIYVLSWLENRIQVIFEKQMSSYLGEPQFERLDGDSYVSILVGDKSSDSWGCGQRVITVYGWNGRLYEPVDEIIKPFNCTARYAEEAMWDWDFATAIELYDSYIAEYRADYEDCWSTPDRCTFTNVRFEYFRARRILAHALLDHTAEVPSLLNDLPDEAHLSQFEQAILAANTDDPQTLCQAAYDYFVDYRIGRDFDEDRAGFTPGVIVENASIEEDLYFTIDPLRAGCDIRWFSGEPTPTPTPTATPWQPQITATPEPVRKYQYLDDALEAEDYPEALVMLDRAIAQSLDNPDYLYHYRYQLAFVLKKLNRPDEALAEYVAIYEAAPDSAWGMLAALHLEVVETE